MIWCFVSCLMIGCAEAPGTDAYAMWERCESSRYAYVFRYLAPPWKFIDETEGGGRQLIAIDPMESRIDYAVESGNLHARIKAVVEASNALGPWDAAREDADRYRLSATSVEGPRLFESGNGIEGVRLDAILPDRRIVAVYHGLRGGGVVSMKVAADEDLDTPDMILLLRGLEPMLSNERE